MRGRFLYSFLYSVNHQVGSAFISLEVQVNLLIDPESALYTSSRRHMVPVLRFLRGVTDNQFRDIFDLYQLVSLFQPRDALVRGVYCNLLESNPLRDLLISSDFLTLIFSRTPFSRVLAYYAQFEDDIHGDSFELYLSLA